MNELAPIVEQDGGDSVALPMVRVQEPRIRPDFATIFGLIFAVGLIAAAISISSSDASFFDMPSVLIVIFGTMAATAISFTGEELAKSGSLIVKSMVRKVQSPSKLAATLVDLSVIAKKKGILALVNYDPELRKDLFLARAFQMVIDGYRAQEVENLLSHEVGMLVERHKRSASIARRAAEIAPAMGLIGTLIGLVQMLANLESPETIGPAMALALLTTFYGAVLGMVIMAPLAVKLEKNSTDEALIKTLIKTAATSIAKQDNPRRLEMLLNAELPPSERIRYFD